MELGAMFSVSYNLHLPQLDHITPKNQRLQDFLPTRSPPPFFFNEQEQYIIAI